ncbi:hypothetical protein Pla22_31330 [Rubripirellula amarantea]|uniref:Peptidase C-terminal archaeal/bacterial domain-containing protein n=1 Tax=Rubripirellula amarantea TaxID=2527999 RepID=A0A5C5WK56_9BACT|nr:ELWxxDGT repeat protein [Rubripirellula amarantea]TWT50391.1 hypothetical protein Pla22_31330 [Rubripirellula amarantea]
MGSTAFFTANLGESGSELWKSDGTEAGTTLVRDIRVGRDSSRVGSLTNVGGMLYFTANDGTTGPELWTSDGTAAGTTLVTDIFSGIWSSRPSYLTNVGGTLYFRADDRINGSELWTSDGTAAGTTFVSDIRVGRGGSNSRYLTNVGGTLYFTANDGTNGYELWTSDGTAAGTTLVSDINAGSADSSPSYLTNVGGVLYFRAKDNDFGNGLWRVDQSDQTAERISDLSNDSPQVDSVFGDGEMLFVVGITDEFGTELYFPTESDDDDQIVESIPLAEGTVSGELETLLGGETDVDMYSFSGSAGEVFDIDVDRPSGELDSALRIFDAAGTQVAFSDNDVGLGPEFSSLEAYLRFTAPSTGTYYVAVTRSSNLTFNANDGSGDQIQDASTDEAYDLVFERLGLTAVDDTALTPENTATVISVSANDFPNGHTVLVGFEDGTDGTVTDNGNGTLTYTPDSGFIRIDTFDYSIALASAELVSSRPSNGDRIGYSVDIDGDYAILGAYLDDRSRATDAGSTFLYRRIGATGWQQIDQLVGDSDPRTHFGWSVAIDGDTVVVGAQQDEDNGFQAGAIYVYDFDVTGATFQAKLTGSDTIKRDKFGRSVDISGDTIVVGASTADPVGSASGAAYVFNRDGLGVWTQAKKLTGSTQGAGDRFGQSVSISGDMVAVGAFRHDGTGNDSGAVYLFERNQLGTENWGEIKAITASDAAAGDQFGYSVSVDGTTVAVGAPLDDTGSSNQLGSVYVLSQNEGGSNNWGQVAKLLADDGVAGDRLGTSVAFDGNRLVAGSPQADGGGNASGRAYLFEKTGGVWDQTRVLVNDEVTTADQYGIAVGLSGDVAVIGSWLDNRPANNSGGAYVFDLQTDTATVTVTVASAPPELPLRQHRSDMLSLSSEAAEPIVLAQRQRQPLTAVQFHARDRVFAASLNAADDEELESYLIDIATQRLHASF